MIFVAVIIIAGAMAFIACSAHAIYRRSQLVDRQKKTLTGRRQQINKLDQELSERLIDSIVDGKSLGQLVPSYIKQRGQLLSEKGPEAGNWTKGDVDHVMNDRLQSEVGKINRKIALRIAMRGVMIAFLTVVAAASLYSYLEKVPLSAPATATPVDQSTPYDPFDIDFSEGGDQV
jgi:hypothetical protein